MSVPDAAASRIAVLAAYAYGVLAAATLGHFLLGIPIQFTDSFGNMLKLSASWPELLHGEFTQRAYLRPLLWAQLKLLYDASGGDYFAWYRGAHVLQTLALVLLYLIVVRPRTWRDAALVPFGLAVLVGSHTFTGTVREAFPINTFLSILLFCFAAAALAFARHRWWTDILAAALFAVAALTVESGLLVWVIFAAAWLTGARGLSRGGVAAVTTLLVGYFVLRFAVLDVGSPDLLERTSGFGFGNLEPEELRARFGADPLPFYAYNVVASVLSVLFAEPRGGVFRLTRGLLAGEPEPSMLIGTIASLGATALIVRYAWRRRTAWLSRDFSRDDRLVLLFVAVLGANAIISYPYTKDVIMSPAGAFLAVAVYAAGRHWLHDRPARVSPATVALVAAVAVLGTAWGLRVAGMHLGLRKVAYEIRNEWVYAALDHDVRRTVSEDPRAAALLQHLHADAVFRHPPPPPLAVPYPQLFELE